MTPYLLDTNIFIQAKNLHYGFDFCPAFWEWLPASGLGLACVSPYEMLQQTFETLAAKAAAPQGAEVA